MSNSRVVVELIRDNDNLAITVARQTMVRQLKQLGRGDYYTLDVRELVLIDFVQ